MMAGVPQLVTPFAHDQFDNAKRLERLGIAKSVKSTGDANAWRQAMRYLTSDTAVRQSCAHVRKLMDSEQNAAELIADQILH
jgi:rhamnosyltransferase subunit B